MLKSPAIPKSHTFFAAHEVLPILEAFHENPQRLTLVQDLGLFTTEALRCCVWEILGMGKSCVGGGSDEYVL